MKKLLLPILLLLFLGIAVPSFHFFLDESTQHDQTTKTRFSPLLTETDSYRKSHHRPIYASDLSDSFILYDAMDSPLTSEGRKHSTPTDDSVDQGSPEHTSHQHSQTDDQKEENKQEVVIEPINIPFNSPTLSNISYERLHAEQNAPSIIEQALQKEWYGQSYSELEGVFTFRGNHMRTQPSFGTVQLEDMRLKILWSFQSRTSSWGGGAGWTGQPAIIRWPHEIKQIMNLYEPYKADKEFVEVIYASLDGYVYFFDVLSGEASRDPLRVGNPIKGSVSVDPRGYPLLYVGEGIPEKGDIGFSLYSLIDYEKLFYQTGLQASAFRNWGAFDGAALFNRTNDSLLVGGENGSVYYIQLHSQLDLSHKNFSIDPKVFTYRYRISGNAYHGIENSIAVYRNIAFFADNGGSVQALDLRYLQPIWALDPVDDTDATISVEMENDTPYLYTATEVDHQGSEGYAYIRKVHGLTGEVIWQRKYQCYSDPRVNGGALATNVIGKHDIDHLVVFTLARYQQFHSGLMVALNKDTGEEEWSWQMPHYAWSSPVDIYTEDGQAYLIQGDSVGNLHLIDAQDGSLLYQIQLGANIEASPAVFENTIVIATRGQKIYGIKIE